MAMIGMTGLVGALKAHNKNVAAHHTKETPPSNVPVEAELKTDMQKVCDALRINNRTKAALEEYDATTLEDLAYMTDNDFDGMLATAARCSRPLCPLQQRKVAVLIWWVRNLVKDTPQFTEDPKPRRKSTVIDRIRHSPIELSMRINPELSDDSKTIDTGTVIPPWWETQFNKDLPMMKKKLKEMGETTSFSLFSDFFLNVRWILCGYAY